MVDEWRYYARRMNGDGTSSPLMHGVPLLAPKLDRELSGPGGFDAEIAPERTLGYKAFDGKPLFIPWSTAIFVEKGGYLRGGYLLTDVEDTGKTLQLTGAGFGAYPAGQPYVGDYSGIQVDPLDVVRMLWAHVQGRLDGNLGLVLDGTTSPVRWGREKPDGAAAAEEGPYVLGWWETHDIGKVIDDIAKTAPFDWRIKHAWDGENISHRMEIGYPSLGSRRRDLRFVIGENLIQPDIPIKYQGEDFADEIMMLGAGEGRKMIRALRARYGTGRLRRTIVVQDKTLTSQEAADRAVMEELSYRLGSPELNELTLFDHPNAPIGSYDVGDEIEIRTKTGFHDNLDLWVRILAIQTEPEKNTETLTVARSEKGQT